MTRWMIAALFAAALWPLPAAAVETGDNRFQIEKTANGFVRLDTRTGALTLCQEKDGALACRMAADERAACEKALDRLERRIMALEKSGATALPDDAQIDRAFTIMEKMMRRFMGMMEDYKKQPESEPLP